MSSNKPIGIFDSGVGGTSIWKEIHHLLPNEHTIYLADSKNAPYGNKSKEEIVHLSIKNTEKLISMGCKLVVVACNTATTNAINTLRNTFPIPFVGIEPAIKPAAFNSKNKKIGILATKGTLSSELFSHTSKLYTKETEIIEIVGAGLVEAIENGDMDTPYLEKLLTKLLNPLIKANIDYLVLGCSHYPYLIPTLKEILPPNVIIIDSGEAAARQTQNLLKQHNILSDSQPKIPDFFSNKNPEVLSRLINAKEKGFNISFLDF